MSARDAKSSSGATVRMGRSRERETESWWRWRCKGRCGSHRRKKCLRGKARHAAYIEEWREERAMFYVYVNLSRDDLISWIGNWDESPQELLSLLAHQPLISISNI
jgi:hypothetical protein